MHLSRNTLISLRNEIYHRFSSSSVFQKMLTKNPLRDAVRFENQNKNWTYQELEAHSNAFAYGLVELGYKPGDKLGLWLEKAYTSEVLAAQIGAMKAGAVLTPISIEKENDLEKNIIESGVKGLIFSPNSKIEDNLYSEILKKTIPELEDAYADEIIVKNNKFKSLKHLIHTGFYSIPGTIKYKQMLVYASQKFNTLALPNIDLKSPAYHFKKQDKYESLTLENLIQNNEKLRKEYKISENDIIFICGDVRLPFQFSLGILNTLTYGNNLVLTGNQNLKNISQILKYHGNSIVIADGETAEKYETGFNQEETKKVSKVLITSQKTPNKGKLEKLFPGLNLVYSQSL